MEDESLQPVTTNERGKSREYEATFLLKRISNVNIKNNGVESWRVGSINELGEDTVNISTSVKLCLLNTWHSLSATTE